jgi:hypothetical protein
MGTGFFDDTAKMAGLLVFGALGVLMLMRKGFGGISVGLD